MTEVLRYDFADHGGLGQPPLDSLGDPELIVLVRSGDSAAFEELFRRHREVAIRYARRLSDTERAEDLCAEAFTKILDLLRRGKGPDVAFRAYLLTTVRTSHLNNVRNANREDLVPDHEPISRMVPVVEDPDARFDRGAICRAFSGLPDRWQVALWLTTVEGLSHEEAGERLGIKSNAVASLTFRARAGLRQAYLAEHLLEINDDKCRAVVAQLPGYLRNQLTRRRRNQVEEHLDTCVSCSAAALELSEVDNRLGALLAPLALVGFGVGAATIQTGGIVAAIQGVSAFLLGNAKAAATAAPGILGTKAVAAVTVTALSVAVGAEVVQQHEAPAVRPVQPDISVPVEAPRILPSTAAARPSAPTPTLSGAPTAAVSSVLISVLPPEALSAPPKPTSGPTSDSPITAPTAAPTPAPTPTSEPTVAARSMAIGEPTDTSYQRGGTRWEQVLIPVSDPVKGASLRITTNRTIQVARATTAGTGWVCGVPTANWFNLSLFAKTRILCSYGGSGTNEPLKFDYQVATNARFTAELTPPSGSEGLTLTDSLSTLTLRD